VSGGPAARRGPIRRLAPGTVERIAAGEVVERPASVVKELVENALDAGASSVTVDVRGGGLERIVVSDDGEGIPADELELAVERHATSKLDPHGPVEGIASLGFRGEALAAIATVSRLRLVSRPGDRDVAEGIAVDAGRVVERFAEPRAPGTTVEVEGLFYNTPARRKFLKAPAREQVEVVRTLERLYLARPSTTVRLRAEGGELASLPAARDLADAAGRVLGAEFPRGSFRVAAAAPSWAVEGALGLPALAEPTSSGLYVSVNGRAVHARGVAQAVRAAFGDTIPRSRFPVGVLHLGLDPTRVDVNVHPAKLEVRLEGSREVEEAVRGAVRDALSGATALHAPPGARAGSAAPGSGVPRPPAQPAALAAAGVAPAPGAQRTLGGSAVPRAPVPVGASPVRPRLEILGPVDALYWVAATADGLVLIDQHAASERVLFETLLAGGTVARQTLVDPVPLALSSAERAALAAHADDVRAAGFEVEPFGPEAYRVRSVPSYRGRSAPAEAVVGLLRELADGGRPTLPNGLAERRAASIACHAAVRAGDAVAPERVAELVAALDRFPDRPRTCPHGRPILVHLPRARLDRWFLRSGP
jgi:DNA mismatch repair protein MutL